MFENNNALSDDISQDKDEISTKDLLLKLKAWVDYLKGKWVIISLIGLLGGGIGFVYAYSKKASYTANLSYVMEAGGGSKGGGLGFIASQLGLDMQGSSGNGIFAGNSLLDLFKSRTLLERVLLNPVTINGKQTTLAEFYIEIYELRIKKWNHQNVYPSTVSFPPGSNSKHFDLQHSSIMESIYQAVASNNVDVKLKDKASSIYIITVVSVDEFFSKTLAELLVKEVSDFYTETKTKNAKKNVDLLEKQTDSVRAELDYALGAVAVANDNTFNLNPALNVKKVTSARKQVDVQANTAILTQLVQNLEIAKMTLMQEAPLIQVIDMPVLPLQKNQMGKAKSFFTGGILFSIFCICFLIMRKRWKEITA